MSATSAKRLLLVGGSSEIAVAIGRRLAVDGPVRPYLLGRSGEQLERAAAELVQAGCEPAAVGIVDAADLPGHAAAVEQAFTSAGGFDIVVIAIGLLGGQEGLDSDPDIAAEVMQVNFLGAGSLMMDCLRALRSQGSGTLIVLSSVAAERARAGNAVYGAAKAGLDALAQGLADATAGTGVRVLVVRPGFVTTKMTEGLPPAPMATTAAAVADATVLALDGKAHTIWVPGRLRYLFSVLRHLPRPVFRRLPL